jgi:hypothetical protein
MPEPDPVAVAQALAGRLPGLLAPRHGMAPVLLAVAAIFPDGSTGPPQFLPAPAAAADADDGPAHRPGRRAGRADPKAAALLVAAAKKISGGTRREILAAAGLPFTPYNDRLFPSLVRQKRLLKQGRARGGRSPRYAAPG